MESSIVLVLGWFFGQLWDGFVQGYKGPKLDPPKLLELLDLSSATLVFFFYYRSFFVTYGQDTTPTGLNPAAEREKPRSCRRTRSGLLNVVRLS